MQAQTDFYEIYDYFYQPLLEKTSFRILLALFVLAIIALIFILFFKRKKRPVAVWEWALKELSALKPERCITKLEYKSFYFQLTGILKTYLNKRFSWQTEDKTDEELILYLQKQDFDSNLMEQLEKALHGASWVKFANEDALKKQAESDLKTVISVVEQTKISEHK
jgi:hypothetical protein